MAATTPGACPASPLSEELAQALREGDTERFGRGSPYAACLVALARALGWRDYSRELLEALPHFSEEFDLTELRNVLVSLGYESSELRTAASRLDPQLLPCIYVCRNGDAHVLLDSTEEGIQYFDAQTGEEKLGTFTAAAGVAYVLTDTHPTHGTSSGDLGQEEWSARLFKRFRNLLLLLFAVTFMVSLAALAIPLFVMLVYDKVIAARAVDALPMMIAGVTIVLIADLGFRQIRARSLGLVAGRLDFLIGVESFRQLLHMPPLYTESSTVTAQLQRLRQFDAIREFFTGSGASVLLELPFSLVAILVIGAIAGPVALIPLLTLLAYVVLALLVVSSLSARRTHAGIARNDKQRMLMQTLEGRLELKAIGAEDLWLERYREVAGTAATAGYSSAVATAAVTAAGQLLMSISVLGVLGLSAAMVSAGEMSIGALVATMALVWRVLTPMQSTYLSVARVQQLMKSLRQINQLMKINVERESTQSGLLIDEMRGDLVLDRVSMRYRPEDNPALLGVSMQAKPGEIVAIVGSTGSGKSTLLKLIAGVYKPLAGALYLDQLDTRQLNVSELRRSIAYVPQDVRLFHGTIAQNLRLNNSLATQDALEAAADEAGVLEDIRALPNGFDTRIGDNATNQYPPGFVRGLTLARALIRPAKVLLLDEPGTSMDEQSDLRFMEQLKRLRGNRTVIMATHRPSHARLADRVVLLEHGAVKFIGDPDEAMAAMLEQVG